MSFKLDQLNYNFGQSTQMASLGVDISTASQKHIDALLCSRKPNVAAVRPGVVFFATILSYKNVCTPHREHNFSEIIKVPKRAIKPLPVY